MGSEEPIKLTAIRVVSAAIAVGAVATGIVLKVCTCVHNCLFKS